LCLHQLTLQLIELSAWKRVDSPVKVVIICFSVLFLNESLSNNEKRVNEFSKQDIAVVYIAPKNCQLEEDRNRLQLTAS
jgi:hypothetical protein